MRSDRLPVERLPVRLTGDAARTIMRFFWPGSDERARRVFDRALSLSNDETARLAGEVVARFGREHPEFRDALMEHFDQAAERVGPEGPIPDERRLLIGAYFTMEYAFESAALFNPSMVPAREQAGVPAGSTRFTMSLRAVGEGHVSSVVFRSGVIDSDAGIHIDPPSRFCRPVRELAGRLYGRDDMHVKLEALMGSVPSVDGLFAILPETFTIEQLLRAVGGERANAAAVGRYNEVTDAPVWLAESNYQLRGNRPADLPELVLFPISQAESRGMEDMRLVRFVDDDGAVTYYGTYTAFNGSRILPQMLAAPRPDAVEVHTLGGPFAQNKGLALFPRKVDGRYAMVARKDGENLFLAWSDSVLLWQEGALIDEPRQSWEFVQIGNCGSPIETDAGWILLTHGVGPMRRYCIGAILLDLADPTRVVGRLREPLLEPQEDERSGYVPNVVYSCGGMIHNGHLVIPYGISDAATGFATVPVDALLERLTS